MNEKQLRAELDAVYRSTSWKITAPLRAASALVRRYFLNPFLPRQWMPKLASMVMRRPALLQWAKRLLVRFPRLQALARRWYHGVNREHVVPVVIITEEVFTHSQVKHLSRTSQLIYNELKQAVKQGK